MRSVSWLSTAACLAAWFAGATADVDPIVIKGSKFFYKTNGTQFYIRGVAYQQNVLTSGAGTQVFSDPLADAAGCARDIPYLQRLNTNTVRVYSVDPTADHSSCMTALANAGIYALIDLGTPNISITSNAPSWTTDLFSHYKSVVDTFQQYNNVLGFFSANEVIFNSSYVSAAPFVKAATRDTKAYIAQKGYRQIGVGYATDDDPSILAGASQYLNCGDAASSIDFFGYNIYSWCGDSSFAASNYQARTEEFSSFNIPVFLSEYGCNTVEPRTFQDTPVIYSSLMDGVWSGAIVYVYFEGKDNFGLVSVTSGSSTVSTLVDFNNYSKQIATVSPTIVTAATYTPSLSAQACPATNSFPAAASPLPPTPDATVCSCMYNSLGCVPAKAVAQSNYGALFSYICGNDAKACAGILANGTTGTYGKYSGCGPVEQLGYVMDQYYHNQGGQSYNCQFSGSAVLRASATPSGTCASVLSSVSASSTGGGSGSKTSTSPAAAPRNVVLGAREGGLAGVMLLIPVAFVSGLGMLLL